MPNHAINSAALAAIIALAACGGGGGSTSSSGNIAPTDNGGGGSQSETGGESTNDGSMQNDQQTGTGNEDAQAKQDLAATAAINAAHMAAVALDSTIASAEEVMAVADLISKAEMEIRHLPDAEQAAATEMLRVAQRVVDTQTVRLKAVATINEANRAANALENTSDLAAVMAAERLIEAANMEIENLPAADRANAMAVLAIARQLLTEARQRISAESDASPRSPSQIISNATTSIGTGYANRLFEGTGGITSDRQIILGPYGNFEHSILVSPVLQQLPIPTDNLDAFRRLGGSSQPTSEDGLRIGSIKLDEERNLEAIWGDWHLSQMVVAEFPVDMDILGVRLSGTDYVPVPSSYGHATRRIRMLSDIEPGRGLDASYKGFAKVFDSLHYYLGIQSAQTKIRFEHRGDIHSGDQSVMHVNIDYEGGINYNDVPHTGEGRFERTTDTGHIDAQFYGPDHQEVGGVFHHYPDGIQDIILFSGGEFVPYESGKTADRFISGAFATVEE